jgi:hypothetical protein
MMPSMRIDGLSTPHPSRLAADHEFFDEIMAAHRAACANGDMGYIDPGTGLFAMTAVYLANRPCCERGCRHCPYVGADDTPIDS